MYHLSFYVPKAHPWFCIWQELLCVRANKIFHCMYTPPFLYMFIDVHKISVVQDEKFQTSAYNIVPVDTILYHTF